MAVRQPDIVRGIEELRIGGSPVCIHSSLKSFGYVEGGANAILDAFLDAGCTVVVPTFCYANEIPPPEHVRIERNGWDEGRARSVSNHRAEPYDPSSMTMTTEDMGAIPAALLKREARVRGIHPIDSFSALGPLAEEIITTQTPTNVYGPLRAIGEHGGWVLLMGVELTRMTLLHTAEQDSGRELFHRWALDRHGQPIETRVGGCSEGFGNLEAAIGQLARETIVGESRWRAFPVMETLSTAAAAIQAEPGITHCGNPRCGTCPDAVLGGPIISA
ncbi:MAG: AAC(3) family N-acetyltransferase [Thermomicrobiales bacterium]